MFLVEHDPLSAPQLDCQLPELLIKKYVEITTRQVMKKTLIMINTLGDVMHPDTRRYYEMEQISFILSDATSSCYSAYRDQVLVLAPGTRGGC